MGKDGKENYKNEEKKSKQFSFKEETIKKKIKSIINHSKETAAKELKPLATRKSSENILKNIRGAEVETIETSCCGMAGSFGYDKDTYDISMKMANEKLFPAIKKSKGEITIIADGTSCRCQIKDGLNKEAIHIAKFLDQNIIY